MSDVVIRAEGLGKRYVIGHEAAREHYIALRDVLARRAKALLHTTFDLLRGRAIVGGDTTEEIWALQDVDFEIKRGEIVGIIGRNGAGKSTLLKILSRITEPTAGQVEIRGRVASLLEIGTGFHAELTGRENIFLNGAILGMSRAEIRSKLEAIVAFAGVEKFVDTPVKRYSSGMYMRLAFSVAAHLDSEILVVDEVLAVGDVEFQKRCLGKMSEVVSRGRTILFVSHNLTAIRTLCPRSIFLQSGRVMSDSDSESAIAAYLTQIKLLTGHRFQSDRKVQDGLYLRSVRITPTEIRTGDSVRFDCIFEAQEPGIFREWALCIFSPSGILVGLVDARKTVEFPIIYQQGSFTLVVEIDSLQLVDREYSIALYMSSGAFHGTLFEVAVFTLNPNEDLDSTYSSDARGVVNLGGNTSLVL
jgi:ABC-type polysaccharide/polyol phosphate transport system ATPase subunit